MRTGSIRTRDYGGPGVGWLMAGYTGLAGFLVLESAVRQRGSASGLEGFTDDQGTARLILGAYAVAAVVPPILRPLRLWRLPRAAGPLGLAIEATGLGVRLWSMRTLDGSYSRTLGTTAEQHVINDGPYRLIRHPGYLGSILTWAGCTVASGSLLTLSAVTGLLAGAYRRRIAVEEKLLVRDLPGYLDYRRSTKKLIPLLW
jgi:protein-S-isoprenylcysteine O-methyltransferase Ste14